MTESTLAVARDWGLEKKEGDCLWVQVSFGVLNMFMVEQLTFKKDEFCARKLYFKKSYIREHVCIIHTYIHTRVYVIHICLHISIIYLSIICFF